MNRIRLQPGNALAVCRGACCSSRARPRSWKGCAGYVLTPLVETYRAAMDLTDAATCLLVAAYAAGAVLLAIPAGIAWAVSAAPRNRRGQVMGLLLGASVTGELIASPHEARTTSQPHHPSRVMHAPRSVNSIVGRSHQRPLS